MLGSSYAFTKLGLEGLDPLSFVLTRLLLGAALLAAWMAVRGERLPRERAVLARLAALGAVNVFGAFFLLTWGQQYVASSYTAVLVASGPIFSAVGAALVLADERLDRRRAAAVALGFVGVVALFAGELGQGPVEESAGHAVAGAVAIVVSAAIIAGVAIGVRLGISESLSGAQIALPQVLAGAIVVAVLMGGAALSGSASFEFHPLAPAVLSSVLVLGIVNAGLGNIVYYRLIVTWGVTRTALVLYVSPFIGVAIGVGLLGESFGASALAGLALITVSVLAVTSSGLRRGERTAAVGEA